MAPSIPWFAAIQDIKSKKDLAGLAAEGCFISAEAVERVVGQIGETQKATRELGSGDGAGHVSGFVRAVVRCWMCVGTA